MRYAIFDESNLERVLKAIGEASPEFRRFRYVELLAKSEKGVVGKYRSLYFLFSKEPFELDVEPIEIFEVEIEKDDGNFRSFRFGKYSLRDKLLLDCNFNEKLFYDYLPALLCEISSARLLIKDCNLRASHLAERESEIVKEITKISEDVKTLSIEKLEELSFEVSALRASFFSSYMLFKDDVEEIFSSIARASSISNFLGGLLKEQIDELRNQLETISYFESRFEQTLSGVRDALDVVHLRLEMLRGKENLELQKRTSALQAAAAVIEFVAVFYYSMKIWEAFLPVTEMPHWLSFSLLAAFTFTVVVYTEALGDYIRERKPSSKLVLLTLTLAILVILMATLPTLFSAASQLSGGH
ncbi:MULTISPECIES: hypothetical protein [Archaeoglobus]|uniref:Uncharacterized protein AF_2239 n=3 Tax=Archaeoglobus fulgidus TaxID=2234 RepID=Y2239_ARCFU|nr:MULTISPECIES: hypothetical protein [Archaeoglobus]O28044.1 RecName: Full=Uncharacterized protein AF_2239 [Archaeoglobus fulgidus DSM 4304]AAB89018.1 predicted coding region AF_2239 [Archaeoglobus fulgidus DSM 4304]AIG99246.1 hypothetical protein AFULGI_00025320 [Archaeoglobus fulgidus DSM 8774]KUJ93642.1 MAG: hypothetical protein XD40_1193 [Archaeoglobus fulgidus]KUK06015.1 MAG: Uncharacterized protein XD48_1747 [Archaeoglobus fulgidus]MDI3497919.1 hypothetical protein [Archaeoglobus sp.]